MEIADVNMFNISQTLPSEVIKRQVQSAESDKSRQPRDRCQLIVGQVKTPQVFERVDIFNLFDEISTKVQNSQLAALLEVFDEHWTIKKQLWCILLQELKLNLRGAA